MTRLCIVLTALAVIGRARVALAPGWVVPLPAVILAVAVTASLAVTGALALHIYRSRTAGWPRAPWGGDGATGAPHLTRPAVCASAAGARRLKTACPRRAEFNVQ